MTTRVEITCKGPDQLMIWFYDHHGDRTSEPGVRLAVGETHAFDTHDGKRAMPFAVDAHAIVTEGETKFYSVPPAHY